MVVTKRHSRLLKEVDIMALYDVIVNAMRQNNAGKLAVVIDSQYLLYERKMVYVSLQNFGSDNVSLKFYVMSMLNNGINQETEIGENAYSAIINMLVSKEMFGVRVNGIPQTENCKVFVSNQLGLLILESAIYCSVRKIAEREQISGTLDTNSVILRFQTNGERETAETVHRLLSAFKQNSLWIYSQLIYSSGNNRFINRLQKTYKFYTIQKSFVPLFIECNLFYNPLGDSLVKRTVLYQTAVQKDRQILFESDELRLSGYFLTHEEICRAFRMRYFMRFTASFWYNFFVGKLYPNASGNFPSLGEKRWYINKNTIVGKNLKPVYTDNELAEQLEIYGKDPDNPENKEMLTLLNLYVEHDTLYKACQDAHAQLTSFGPTSLDDNESSSVQSIYTYLSQAQIEFV